MARKWITIFVAAVVVVAAVFGFAGYTLGTSAGRTQAAAQRQAFLQSRGVGGAQGQGSGQFNPNNFGSGQVKSISGNTIQLSTATAVVTVQLNSGTQVLKLGPGSASDIQTGERVTVQGTRNGDGSFAAQSVQIGRQPAASAANGSAPNRNAAASNGSANSGQ